MPSIVCRTRMVIKVVIMTFKNADCDGGGAGRYNRANTCANYYARATRLIPTGLLI